MTETETTGSSTGGGSDMPSATQTQAVTSTGHGSEGRSSSTPATTMPPDVSSTSTDNEAISVSETANASAEPTDNVGVYNGRGSLVAILGAVVGAVALM